MIPNEPWRPRFNPWLIAISVMLATFMEVLDTSVANVSLPHIAGNLGVTPHEATWVLTSYLVANAIVLPASAWLGRVFGRKNFLMFCIVSFTAASALCGAATSLNMLILARILQGAGGGALQPVAQAILLESFPPHKRGQAMAAYGMGVVLAPILGPTLGGWITDNYSWRWIFYINLPIGLLAMFMAWSFLEDPPHIKNAVPGRIDYVGFGFMAIGLAALQVLLDNGQEADWFSVAWMRWLGGTTLFCLVAFIVWELTVEHPIVNLRVLRHRNFALGTLLITVVGGVLYSTNALLPLFLQTLMGYPAVDSGLAVSPRGFGAFTALLLVGRIIGLIDNRLLVAIGFGGLSAATYWFSRINLDIGILNVALPNILSGFATGMIFVPVTTLANATLPMEEIGDGSGIFNLMRNVGGSVGISVATTILARSSQTGQTALAAHMTPYDTNFNQALEKAQHLFGAGGALPFLYHRLVEQASVLSYVHNFQLWALICLLCAPLAFIMRRGRVPGGPISAH